MSEVRERQVELPDPKRSGGLIVWKLSARGLEWDGGRNSAAWMPFACMRGITLGSVSALGGWRMRIAGPPGALLIGSSHYKTPQSPEMATQFLSLASDVIRGATERGCPPKLRMNDRHIVPEFLWARLGVRVPASENLLERLEVSPK